MADSNNSNNSGLFSSLLGFGSNLITNLFNRGSTNKTNETNLKIAQINNDWSERMMQKQMDYNTDMWNKTNQYNSAASQRKRLEEAGLNPSLMMNGGNAGIAQGASSPSLPSPSSAVMQPNRYDFSGIGESVINAYRLTNETKVADEQARFLGNQADWYSAKAMADIAEAFSNVHNKNLQSKGIAIQNKWADSMLGAQYVNQIRQNQSLEVSMMNAIKQGVLMDKQIARYDEQTNAQIADLVASAALKYSQGELNKAELMNVIETNKSIKLSNKEKEAIFDYVVEQASAARFKGYTPWSIGADLFHGAASTLDKWYNKMFK